MSSQDQVPYLQGCRYGLASPGLRQIEAFRGIPSVAGESVDGSMWGWLKTLEHAELSQAQPVSICISLLPSQTTASASHTMSPARLLLHQRYAWELVSLLSIAVAGDFLTFHPAVINLSSPVKKQKSSSDSSPAAEATRLTATSIADGQRIFEVLWLSSFLSFDELAFARVQIKVLRLLENLAR